MSMQRRAAIAEAALKDSQQIVSRQHDALEQTSERLRLNDQQLDLMRNALHRRDELLGSQRAAFYKELLRFQAFAEHEATHARPPASEYASVHESPAFFDACVFEALHLTADEPLVQKAAKALQVAVKQQGVLSEEADAAAKAAAEELRLAQRAAAEREGDGGSTRAAAVLLQRPLADRHIGRGRRVAVIAPAPPLTATRRPR